MALKQVATFVKNNGILLPCKVFPTADGCVWSCAACGRVPLLRASFGVLSGFWRCTCGAEVELFVDGQVVPIGEINELPNTMADEGQFVTTEEAANEAVPVNDEDFLRECGIANPLEE